MLWLRSAAAAALLLCACSAVAHAAGETRGTLVFAGDMDYPPVQYLYKGEPRGLVYDVLKAIEDETDTRFEIHFVDWDEAQERVLDGRADALGLMTISPERLLLYDFTDETITVTFSLFARAADTGYNALTDLRGKKVAVTQGGYPAHHLANHPTIEPVYVPDYRTGFERLLAGDVEAVAADTWVGAYTLGDAGIKGVRVATYPFAVREAGFAVKKGNHAALAALNQGLNTIRASGRLERVLATYRPKEIIFLTRERLSFWAIWGSLGIVSALLTAALVALAGARRQVRRQTSALRHVNETLERRVAERTDELLQSNESLRREVERRALTEATLRKSEDRFRTLYDAVPAVIVNIRADWRIVGLNREGERFFGVREADVRGKDYLELFIPQEVREELRPALRMIFETGRLDNYENVVLGAGGSQRRMKWNACLMTEADEDEPIVLAVGFDITEEARLRAVQSELEDRLRQADKLHAIGLLAGGVAHDFNNQLTGILAFAEAIRQQTVDPTLTALASRIERAARHAAVLTQQLLTFARKGTMKSEPVDVGEVVRDVVAMLERSVDKLIRIETAIDCDSPIVKGDAVLLQNCLLNLAINARDAMPQGGLLRIALTECELDQDALPTPAEEHAPGRYLCVTVSDTGIGMSKDVLRRIFDPFFSTKTDQPGLGMGLALVYGTVRSHAGFVKVESEVGKGTSFQLYLPANADASAPVAQPLDPRARLATPLRILVVDDEELVREAATEMLLYAGASVDSCTNGQEALDILAARADSFDVVVMDASMPILGGLDATRSIRRLHPRLKVLLVSGYFVDTPDGSNGGDGPHAIVQKPFSTAELIKALNDLTSGP